MWASGVGRAWRFQKSTAPLYRDRAPSKRRFLFRKEVAGGHFARFTASSSQASNHETWGGVVVACPRLGDWNNRGVVEAESSQCR